MTFDSFVERYIGKAVDYDGVAGVQCVDLVKLKFSAYVQARGEMQEIIGLIFHHTQL